MRSGERSRALRGSSLLSAFSAFVAPLVFVEHHRPAQGRAPVQRPSPPLEQAPAARDRPLDADAVAPTLTRVLTGFAHTAVCVPDVRGGRQLVLRGPRPPGAVAAVPHGGRARSSRTWASSSRHPSSSRRPSSGFGADDRVIELIDYPAADVAPPEPGRPSVTRVGITHVGMLCDDIGATRAELEGRGVEFLTRGNRRRGRPADDLVPRSVGNGHHPPGEERGCPSLLGPDGCRSGRLRPRACACPDGRETDVPRRRSSAHVGHEMARNLHSCPEGCALQGARRPQWAP